MIEGTPQPSGESTTGDPLIAALDPATRSMLGDLWAERAQSELNAGAGFSVVVTELYALGADPAVIRLATRAAHDEVRHAERCQILARAYGREVRLKPKAVAMPPHRGADDRLRKHLHVIGLCCINETLAAGFIEACLRACRSRLVRSIHLEHLQDEIDHGRIGWAHLATLDDATKAAIAPWVPRLIRVNRRHWQLRIAELPEQGVPGHGYPPQARLFEAIDETLTQVVIPGFRHVGIDPRPRQSTN